MKIPYGESAQGKLGRLSEARKQPNKPVQQAPFDRLVRRGSREAQVLLGIAHSVHDDMDTGTYSFTTTIEHSLRKHRGRTRRSSPQNTRGHLHNQPQLGPLLLRTQKLSARPELIDPLKSAPLRR